jgi:CHAT domain-containing protein
MKLIFRNAALFILLILSFQIVIAQSKEQLNIRMLEAAKNGQADSVEFWLNKGANVDFLDSIGFSALHYAAGLNQLETIQLLILAGGNVNIKAKSGSTPIMNAAYYDFLRICHFLYKNKATLNLKDKQGNTCVDYARDGGCLRVQKFLDNPKTYSELPTYYEYYDSATTYLFDKKNIPQTLVFLEKSFNGLKSEITNRNPNYFPYLKDISDIYMFLNEFEKAEPIVLELLGILKDKDLIDKQEYIDILNKLAVIYNNRAFYSKSDSIYLEAIKIETEIDSTSRSYANTIHNYAMLNYDLGNYKKAETLFLKAIQIEKEKSGETGRRYATFLNNLGLLYWEIRNYPKAEIFYSEAFKIREKFGEKDQDYLNSLDNIAALYQKTGKNKKAIQLYTTILKIKEEINGEFGYDYAANLHNLAEAYKDEGNDSIAETLYLSALKIWEHTLGKNHPFYSTGLFNLASVYLSMNEIFKAETHLSESASILKNNLINIFSFLSEKERENNWHKIKKYINSYDASFVYNYSHIKSSFTILACDNELFSKGILLNTSRLVKQTILNSGDTALIAAWERMNDYQRTINFLESKPKENQFKLNNLKEDVDQLNKVLTQKSQIYRQVKTTSTIGWHDVRDQLTKREAAIEFTSFSYYNKNWTDSILYCALVVKKDMEHPEMIPLFEQKQLDSLWVGGNLEVNYLYASRGVETIVNNNHVPNGKKLYNLIWKPLEKSLEDVHTVYYAPSGNLHQVAFAALPVDSATYLCDQFNLVQLSSTRQLATSEWQTGEKDFTNAVLFGGIKYDLEEQELAQLKQSLPPKEETILNEFRTDSTLRSGGHTFLEGTKTEIDSIAFTLQTENISAAVYSGISANEESFKALTDQDIGILHIATHGFFFPDEKIEYKERERFMLFGEQRFRKASNPLLRSGLILAGGNRVWKGEEPVPGMEDGILTAQEISEMYLPNTELVVLSACETGLGEIQGGEGVFGLQRAFKLAGVETILMSLWKVPDNETSELMQIFYKKWLNGMDKHAAFRSAQLELRHKYPHEPKKWAGFVMVD